MLAASIMVEPMCGVAWPWALVPLPSAVPSTTANADITAIRVVIEFVCWEIARFAKRDAGGRGEWPRPLNIKEELTMTRIKFLGLAIGASLLLAYQPIANATPMAAPLIKAEASTGNFVVQARIHHGVAIRHERRAVRRGYYDHYWTDVVTLTGESAQSDGITPKRTSRCVIAMSAFDPVPFVCAGETAHDTQKEKR
jgi:hypothetical protein